MSKNSPKLPPLPDDGGARQQAAEARRAAAAQAMKTQRGAERRRRVLIQLAIGLVVVLVAVGVTIVALNSKGDSGSNSATDLGATATQTTPPSVNSDGAFVASNPKAKVTIQVVEDFQCPICRQFEQISGSLMDSYLTSDDVQVQYRTIAFLDRMSSTQYSTRALNASACVMPAGEEIWKKFHDALFANQPPENGDGLPDSELIKLAEDSGASSSVASCIENKPYADWTAQVTKQVFSEGVTGTPTIFVDGQKLNAFDPTTIKNAVDAALAK